MESASTPTTMMIIPTPMPHLHFLPLFSSAILSSFGNTVLVTKQILLLKPLFPRKGIKGAGYLALNVGRHMFAQTSLLDLFMRQLISGRLDKVIVRVLKAG